MVIANPAAIDQNGEDIRLSDVNGVVNEGAANGGTVKVNGTNPREIQRSKVGLN